LSLLSQGFRSNSNYFKKNIHLQLVDIKKKCIFADLKKPIIVLNVSKGKLIRNQRVVGEDIPQKHKQQTEKWMQ